METHECIGNSPFMATSNNFANRIRKNVHGKDLRSIGNVNEIVTSVQTQQQFDVLFKNLLSHERIIEMRSADAVEKLTKKHPEWLQKHKPLLLELLHNSTNKELNWHLAQLVSRLSLTDIELYVVWDKLAYWMLNRNESRIVRVNSLQALYDLSIENSSLLQALRSLVQQVHHEAIPSINARLRKLKL